MLRSSNRFRKATPEVASDVVYDDGGSGLLAACESRFGSSDFEISCDAKHSVWVKHKGSGRSVGLSPWLLNRRTMDEVLETVETKLGGGND